MFAQPRARITKTILPFKNIAHFAMEQIIQSLHVSRNTEVIKINEKQTQDQNL